MAFLGKHVLSLMHKPDKLWVRLFGSKYLKSHHILDIDVPSRGSYIWTSIIRAASYLSRGFKYRIGKGDISILFDKWLEDNFVCELIPFVNIQEIHLKIKDICVNNQLHWERMATIIPHEIKLKMQSFFVDSDSADTLIWGHANSGIYSTKSAYRWLVHEPLLHINQEDNWSWVWKLPLPENIKHFLWLILHGSLPTNLFRANSHISLDSSCNRCGAAQESISHAIRNCYKARQIWRVLHMGQQQHFYTQPLKEWLYSNLYHVCCLLLDYLES